MVKTTPSASSQSSGTPTLKKSNSGSTTSKNQKTLHGFFQKTPVNNAAPSAISEEQSLSSSGHALKVASKSLPKRHDSALNLTPAPSSDGPDIEDESTTLQESATSHTGLISPVTPANEVLDGQTLEDVGEVTTFGTPSRKVSHQLIRRHITAPCLTIMIGQEGHELCRVGQ